MADCTELERAFLDILRAQTPRVDYGECPVCGYDALDPDSEEMRDSLEKLLESYRREKFPEDEVLPRS